MKVVFAHTDFRIYWPARLRALNTFLDAKGIDFEVIEIAGKGSPYNFAESSRSYPANWHVLFPSSKMEEINPVVANSILRKKLDELMPDIVFAGSIAFPSGAAAVRWANEKRKKVVIFDNARLQDVPRTWGVNFIKKRIYSGVDAVFCPASSWNPTFNYYGFKDDQIFYGVNVADNDFWQNGELDAVDHMPHNYILGVGRQVEKKNIRFLLTAYREYVQSVADPKDLVLVGDGPRRKLLQEYVEDSALENVHFLPFITQEELRTLYRNASYFVMPSKFGETWGLSVNEAMASGLPVLVSNQAGCSSTLVSEGKNGFTFSPDNVSELSKLLSVMHNKTRSELAEMSENSVGIISEWGLDRFCSGAYKAISMVTDHKRKRTGLISMVMIKLWKGRYRPT